MPELPEVETIRRGLIPRLAGCAVDRLVFGDRKVFQAHPGIFRRRLPGQKVQEILRRGKFLILELERDCCIFHLGMTGQLTVRDPVLEDSGFLRHPVTGLQRSRQHAPDRHTHFQMHFTDGRALLFRDIRKFGRVFLVGRGSGAFEQLFGRLGLEPFTDTYRLDHFVQHMGGRRVLVKSLLLDQGFVAGVGNIYADEALFEAGIHPLRRVHRLRKYEKERLFGAISRVLQRGIDSGGTSLRDYINSDGEQGSNQEDLRVYGRQGQPCRICGHPIEKIVVAQRGTHFCPHCQRRAGGPNRREHRGHRD